MEEALDLSFDRLLMMMMMMMMMMMILCTVNTQHTSRQEAIITIRLYLATCFGRKRPSSGQFKNNIKVQKK